MTEEAQRNQASIVAVDSEPEPADPERAAANIREWRTYLPEDCVERMIQDGWHWST